MGGYKGMGARTAAKPQLIRFYDSVLEYGTFLYFIVLEEQCDLSCFVTGSPSKLEEIVKFFWPWACALV